MESKSQELSIGVEESCPRIWGKAGITTLKNQSTAKIADRGVQCIFVGYAIDHEGDCYQMWDPITERIHKTCDIIWLNRIFYKRPDKLGEDEPIINSDEDVEVDIGVRRRENENNNNTVPLTTTPPKANEAEELPAIQEESKEVEWYTVTRCGREVRRPQRLIEEELGGILTKAETNYYQVLADVNKAEFTEDDPTNIEGEVACVGAGVGGGFENTNELHVMKYNEAMKTEDKKEWKQAIKEELE
jgi:hypothetical protein